MPRRFVVGKSSPVSSVLGCELWTLKKYLGIAD